MQGLSRKEREELQRRSEILATAERLFAVKGYEKTGISDIAEESEFSVGMIYKFFESKEKLYLVIISKKFRKMDEAIRNRVFAQKLTVDKVDVLIDAAMGFFEANKDFFRIFVAEFGAQPWNIRQTMGEELHTQYEEYLDFISGIFRQGIEEGIFKDYEPRKLALALGGLIDNIIGHYFFQEKDEVKITDDVGFITDLFISGILKDTRTKL